MDTDPEERGELGWMSMVSSAASAFHGWIIAVLLACDAVGGQKEVRVLQCEANLDIINT